MKRIVWADAAAHYLCRCREGDVSAMGVQSAFRGKKSKPRGMFRLCGVPATQRIRRAQCAYVVDTPVRSVPMRANVDVATGITQTMKRDTDAFDRVSIDKTIRRIDMSAKSTLQYINPIYVHTMKNKWDG